MFIDRKYKNGFTIVELLVVIVVIAILVIITIVGFPGVIKDAVDASLKGNLDSVSKQLKTFQTSTIANGKYPTRVDDCPTPAAGNLCIKSNGNNKLSYTPDNNASPKNFRVTSYNEDYGFYYSNDANGIKCPLNFVIVPGSDLYGTKDFCAMKYEAKKDSPTVPISMATGLPWDNIAQELSGTNNDAVDYSKNVANCNNCHLTTEAEWMTIAHNLLSVDSNWSDEVVPGYYYIYRGNSSGLTSGPVAASKKDSEGYIGMGSTHAGDATLLDGEYITGDSQRRTLTLSNGEVIWDIAGNISEFTTGHTIEGVNDTPGMEGVICDASYGNTFREWNDIDYQGSLVPNSSIRGMTDISGYQWLSSGNGIGEVCSTPREDNAKSYVRGGSWVNGLISGVLSFNIHMAYQNENGNEYIGFRVTR